MIDNHPSIEIEKFATDVKSALLRNSDVEEFQNMGEIADMVSFRNAVVNVTAVSIYIQGTSYRSQADCATVTEAIFTALSEHSKCKDIVSLGSYIVAVFDTAFKNDIDAALDCVGKVTALFNLVNKIYGQTMHPGISYGVGMNYGKALLTKSMGGENPQYVWSGDAITVATRLSEKASSEKKVYASYTIFNNLKEDYQKLFSKAFIENYYEATPVNIARNKWINANV